MRREQGVYIFLSLCNEAGGFLVFARPGCLNGLWLRMQPCVCVRADPATRCCFVISRVLLPYCWLPYCWLEEPCKGPLVCCAMLLVGIVHQGWQVHQCLTLLHVECKRVVESFAYPRVGSCSLGARQEELCLTRVLLVCWRDTVSAGYAARLQLSGLACILLGWCDGVSTSSVARLQLNELASVVNDVDALRCTCGNKYWQLSMWSG